MNRFLLRATNSSIVHPGYFRLDMSIIQRLIGHGRALLRYHIEGIYNKNPNLGKLDPIIINVNPLLGKSSNTTGVSQVLPQRAPSPGGTFEWIGQGIQNTRRFFVDNILRRVTNSLSSGLQQRASQQLLYANNSRPFFALIGVSLASGSGLLTKENEFEGICWEIRESFEKKQRQIASRVLAYSEAETPSEPVSVQDLEFGPLIAQGSSAAVYSARWKNTAEAIGGEEDGSYPLGVKMMFNFYCESNSAMILRAMCKEIVPARNIEHLGTISMSELERLNRCPSHPNIIEISHVFTDQVPLLSESLEKYPDALPRRLNETGLGRNMSLFLVMKRYDTNLQDYLHRHSELKLRNRILLLTQLLEGVAHLNANEIAHRDLKSDNILLSTARDQPEYPHLVITDFGCCLADRSHGLHLPFPSVETDRGGNAALMAPEVSGAQPGSWKKISYEKSDVWSVGAIAYEIFGERNPFVRQFAEGQKHTLDSRKYDEKELPVIGTVPPLINDLVHNLLKIKPSERLSAEMAATICHIYLWAPSRWFFLDTQRIPDSEIMQWLLTLTTKLLCQMPKDALKLEFTLIRTFLRRLRFTIVRHALEWIHVHTTHTAAAVPTQ